LSAGKILVVDDDPQIRRVMKATLVGHSYEVIEARTGEDAMETILREMPSLVLLDMNMPGMGGLETCRAIRGGSDIPVIILSVRNTEKDKVAALDAGADDYVTKPFSPRELIARVKALLRRAEPPADAPRVLEIGKLAIDPASYRVSHSGKPVPLSTLEFRLLYYLASRPNRVFTRDQLLDAVWGTDRFVTPRSVDVYVRRLREKIETDPENPLHLKTVRGAGYLFETRAA